VKEEKVITREAITNAAGELSESSSELVESLKLVREAWHATVSEHAALDNNIAHEITALENHKLELLVCFSFLSSPFCHA